MLGRFLGKLGDGLAKTRANLLGRIGDVTRRWGRINDDMLEEIEEILIEADIGLDATLRIIENVREQAKERRSSEILGLLKEEIIEILRSSASNVEVPEDRPWVILIVGINGVGKTTTIGKLAKRYVEESYKVLLAACDTFRAAAIEQLEIWAKRAGVGMVHHQMGADAGSVAFDALRAAQARGADVLIVDTAGRLHTKVNLMEEIKKVKRVLGRCQSGAPHEILLVLDATTGQNAIAQARKFEQALGLTGIVLAKLDGTAKGGIVVAISDQLRIPVKMVGIGEQIEDLRDFDPVEFAEALFG